jgi:hypothetical protein
VNARRIPAGLQDPLMSGVNALHEQTPVCLPPVQAATPPPTPTEETRGSHGPEKKKHGHGHGKGGKH